MIQLLHGSVNFKVRLSIPLSFIDHTHTQHTLGTRFFAKSRKIQWNQKDEFMVKNGDLIVYFITWFDKYFSLPYCHIRSCRK